MGSLRETRNKVILSVLLALFFSQSALAEVRIGLTIPQTGPYARQGEEQLKAFELAINQVNSRGTLPGGFISYEIINTQSKPDAAVAGARQLIDRGAVMLSGGASSAVAVAISAEAQRRGVVFMAGLTNANSTTGADAHRHTFRWYHTAHQNAKVLSRILFDRLGKDARYAYIYADYSWGRNVTQTMRNFVEAQGATTTYTAATPLGIQGDRIAGDMRKRLGFLVELEAAAKTKPDALVCVQFGSDLVAILQQAKKLRLNEKMTVVAPIIEMGLATEAGSEALDGVITTVPWYHALSERYEGSRQFVQDFEMVYGHKPGNAAATAFVNIMVWADAVTRAGTTDSATVIRAIEDHRFTLLTKEEYFRKWDHQGIHSVYALQGKKAPAGSQDLFDIIFEMDGEQAARTMQENPVTLESLPGDTIE